MQRKRYASDLTGGQWALISPHHPAENDRGRPRETSLREVVNALLYISRTGCQWSMLPGDFPPRSTVHDYFSAWRDGGTLDEISRVLREKYPGKSRSQQTSLCGSH
nr:transposase [Legionella genomosp. 1]